MALLAMVGCSAKPTTGEVQLVAMMQGASADDVTQVVVTVA